MGQTVTPNVQYGVKTSFQKGAIMKTSRWEKKASVRDTQEFRDRLAENIAACERWLGKPLKRDDRLQVESMVAHMMEK
jgi:hypothetical protein